ncbi:MAG: phosphoribosylformylglycinamidine synthase subunit PurS [Candidatus Dormibacteria bacterium]
MRFRAEVTVSLKPVVNDPQGLVIRDGLHQLGFEAVQAVRAGKQLVVELDAADLASARVAVAAMCERLLVNPVIEEAVVSVHVAPPAQS